MRPEVYSFFCTAQSGRPSLDTNTGRELPSDDSEIATFRNSGMELDSDPNAEDGASLASQNTALWI